MSIRYIFRKFVCSMAKPIPGRTPFWPLVLGSVGLGLIWTYLPYIFLIPTTQHPILVKIIQSLPFPHYIPYILAYGFPTILSFICLMPICRGIQLINPQEFDQYNDEE